MTTTRNQLHVNKLQEFMEFCISKGWMMEPSKGEYEVLRMRKSGIKDPLLVYRKLDTKEHYTAHGAANDAVRQYLKAKRESENGGTSQSQ